MEALPAITLDGERLVHVDVIHPIEVQQQVFAIRPRWLPGIPSIARQVRSVEYRVTFIALRQRVMNKTQASTQSRRIGRKKQVALFEFREAEGVGQRRDLLRNVIENETLHHAVVHAFVQYPHTDVVYRRQASVMARVGVYRPKNRAERHVVRTAMIVPSVDC